MRARCLGDSVKTMQNAERVRRSARREFERGSLIAGDGRTIECAAAVGYEAADGFRSPFLPLKLWRTRSV